MPPMLRHIPWLTRHEAAVGLVVAKAASAAESEDDEEDDDALVSVPVESEAEDLAADDADDSRRGPSEHIHDVLRLEEVKPFLGEEDLGVDSDDAFCDPDTFCQRPPDRSEKLSYMPASMEPPSPPLPPPSTSTASEPVEASPTRCCASEPGRPLMWLSTSSWLEAAAAVDGVATYGASAAGGSAVAAGRVPFITRAFLRKTEEADESALSAGAAPVVAFSSDGGHRLVVQVSAGRDSEVFQDSMDFDSAQASPADLFLLALELGRRARPEYRVGEFQLQYEDEEGDMCTLTNTTAGDALLAAQAHDAGRTSTLKVTAIPRSALPGALSEPSTQKAVAVAMAASPMAAATPAFSDAKMAPPIDGTYECHLYDKGGKNDWHYVTIESTGKANEYKWWNQAGATWTLTWQPETATFAVGDDCPYYKDGHKSMGVVLGLFSAQVVAVLGPWGERYNRDEAQMGFDTDVHYNTELNIWRERAAEPLKVKPQEAALGADSEVCYNLTRCCERVKEAAPGAVSPPKVTHVFRRLKTESTQAAATAAPSHEVEELTRKLREVSEQRSKLEVQIEDINVEVQDLCLKATEHEQKAEDEMQQNEVLKRVAQLNIMQAEERLRESKAKVVVLRQNVEGLEQMSKFKDEENLALQMMMEQQAAKAAEAQKVMQHDLEMQRDMAEDQAARACAAELLAQEEADRHRSAAADAEQTFKKELKSKAADIRHLEDTLRSLQANVDEEEKANVELAAALEASRGAKGKHDEEVRAQHETIFELKDSVRCLRSQVAEDKKASEKSLKDLQQELAASRSALASAGSQLVAAAAAKAGDPRLSAKVLVSELDMAGAEADSADDPAMRRDVTDKFQSALDLLGCKQAFCFGVVRVRVEQDPFPIIYSVTMQNDGQTPWPSTAMLLHESGLDLGAPLVEAGPVAPGCGSTVSMELTVPKANEPGTSTSTWVLRDVKTGRPLGPVLVFESEWVEGPLLY